MGDLYLKADDSVWVRPADWLPIDHLVTNTDEKFIGLFAIFPDKPNVIAIGSSQACTIDWGDGTITNHTSGTSEKKYIYSSISSSTLTSEGFKQAVITVTPVSLPYTGQFFYNANRLTYPVTYLSQFIDIKFRLPNAAFITGTSNWQLYLAKIVALGNVPATSYASRFFAAQMNYFSLDLSNATNLDNTFSASRGFFELGNITAPNATSALATLAPSSIKKIGNVTINSATSVASFATSCAFLTSVGNFTANAATAAGSLFSNCSSLKTIGNVTLNSVLDIASGFNSCLKLTSIGTITIPSATTISNLFSRANSLKSVSIITSSVLTTISSAFSQSYSFETISISNCSGVTNTTSTLSDCRLLKSLTLTGLTRGIIIPPCQMDEAAFINFFNSLGTASGSQTIVITGNITLSPSTIAIATGKGFTVTP